MENGMILVGSVSYAMKAKRLLSRNGIRVNIVKDSENKAGCSYGLSFDERDRFRIAAILAEAGIRIRERESGQ